MKVGAWGQSVVQFLSPIEGRANLSVRDSAAVIDEEKRLQTKRMVFGGVFIAAVAVCVLCAIAQASRLGDPFLLIAALAVPVAGIYFVLIQQAMRRLERDFWWRNRRPEKAAGRLQLSSQ